jgi:hypothetical protein
MILSSSLSALSPRHRIIQIGRPLTVNPSSLSPAPRLILISTLQLIPALTVRRTRRPNTMIDISLSISPLPRHPPMLHSSLTFLPLLIRPILCPRPCAPKAGPRHKAQYIPRPQRRTTPISTSCPSRIQPRTTHPKTNPNRLSKSPV